MRTRSVDGSMISSDPLATAAVNSTNDNGEGTDDFALVLLAARFDERLRPCASSALRPQAATATKSVSAR